MPDRAKKVWQGKVFSAWQWEQKLYDGSTKTYERLKRNDVAHTVGILPDGRIFLTEDEQPDRQAVITPPGGSINPGESPKQGAERELLEETGYQAGELVFWHSYQPNGKLDWTVHAFIGRELVKVAEPQPEPGERIKPLFFSFEEFLALSNNPKMRDLVIRIILLEARLDLAKKEELRKLFYGRK